MSLSAGDLAKLKTIAAELGMPWEWLWVELNFESRFRPSVKNPHSSARGIMQWTNDRARDLGYRDSLELVTQNPTVSQQLDMVRKDLKRYKPFPTFQSLAMAVFLPAYRYKDADTELPDWAQSVNAGIKTVGDYVRKAARAASGGIEVAAGMGAGALVVAIAVTLVVMGKGKKGGT